MNTLIPSIDYLRGRLSGLTDGQLRRIAKNAGVAHNTVRRIVLVKAYNPGIETCRSIDSHVDAVRAEPVPRERKPHAESLLNGGAK